jgi:hypothetical protein
MLGHDDHYRQQFTHWLVTCCWLAAVLASFVAMIDREVTPGEAAAAPDKYPDGILPPRSADRATLVMFAHPRCPCTSASMDELSQILQTCPGRADVRILFRTPARAADDWKSSALWEAATELPDTTITPDPDGAIASQCGVATSGHVLLYGASGKLLFSGGITGSRGHVGENAGRNAVVAILSGGQYAGRGNATFGCPLFDHKPWRETKACPVP